VICAFQLLPQFGIPENYPLLKPVMATFFPKGNKKAIGTSAIEEVATNAFYTRLESQIIFFLDYYAQREKGKPLHGSTSNLQNICILLKFPKIIHTLHRPMQDTCTQ